MRCLIFCLLIALLTVGCGNYEKQNKEMGMAYQVEDDYGNIVKFNSKPQRVYASTLSIEEVLVDLLEPERFAAISEDALDERYSLIVKKATPVAKKVPAKINVEGVLALQPDLVIVQENLNKSQINALKDVGLKVFVTKVPTNLDMVEKRILKISQALGEPEKGQKLVDDMNAKLQRVTDVVGKLPEEKRKIAMAYSLLGAFGSKEGLFHDICVRSGLRNGAAMAGLVRGEHLSKEKILAINPELFIFPRFSSTQKGDVERMRQEVLNDPSLQTVKAVQQKRYILINDRYRYSASQHMADAITIISQQAYPELYNLPKGSPNND